MLCQGGLRVVPDALLSKAPDVDGLVVPGGPGTRRPQAETQPLVDYIRRRADQAEVVASVCTGAFLLARAGLLNGRRATTHWRWREALAARFPGVGLADGRVVDSGPVVTRPGSRPGWTWVYTCSNGCEGQRPPGRRRGASSGHPEPKAGVPEHTIDWSDVACGRMLSRGVGARSSWSASIAQGEVRPIRRSDSPCASRSDAGPPCGVC